MLRQVEQSTELMVTRTTPGLGGLDPDRCSAMADSCGSTCVTRTWPIQLLKDEQDRITRELTDAEEKLQAASIGIDRVDFVMRRSLEFLGGCYETCVLAPPQTRRQMNQAVFEAFMVSSKGVFAARPNELFQTLLRPDALRLNGRAAKATASFAHDSTDWINGRPRLIVEAEARRSRPGSPTPVRSGPGLNKDSVAESMRKCHPLADLSRFPGTFS